MNYDEIKYLRRLPKIKKIIQKEFIIYFADDRDFRGIEPQEVVEYLVSNSAQSYYFKYMDSIYVGGKEFNELKDFLKKYIIKNYMERIVTTLNLLK